MATVAKATVPAAIDDPSSNFTTMTTGLMISNTERIRAFMESASADRYISSDLRDLASSLSRSPSVPYKSLRSIWLASDRSNRSSISAILFGSQFVFASPKPREKSEELKRRLKELAEAAERNAYQELVKDITPKKPVDEPFSSYKDQLGLGLHVVLIMFTGYLVGYAAFRALFGNNPALSAAGGILGLVGGMIVETLLFIIRTSNQNTKSTSFVSAASKVKKNQ